MSVKFQQSTITGLVLFLAGSAVLFYFLRHLDGKNEPTYTFPSSSPSSDLSNYPSHVIDLAQWKLTLPIQSDSSELPMDVKQPELATYQNLPWFGLTADKKGIVFRAPVNAPTTANSTYPRTELREMAKDGPREAFWPSDFGTHTLVLEEAITAAPKHKPDVVAGQIHGDDDDLIVVRLEGSKLFLARSKANLATLDENYVLGKKFAIKFVAQNGQIKVYYNNGISPVHTLDKKVKQAYFKAGVYTQSNCETEGSPDLCNDNNYGEAVIYKLTVSHR